MKLFSKIVTIGGLFSLLVGVRFFETELFYDPLLVFYKGDYLTQEPPVFNAWRLILNTAFRYGLNTFFSLLILWTAFRDPKVLKFAAWLYGLAFLVLIALFTYLLFKMKPENYFMVFYVRRFLIQPLFVLLLLPAFYYQKNSKKSK